MAVSLLTSEGYQKLQEEYDYLTTIKRMEVAERLQEFKRLSSSLWGYCWDIAGSLAGVLAFSLIGFMNTFPVYWFCIIFSCGLFFFWHKRFALLLYITICSSICILISANEKASFYSPYYAIDYKEEKNGVPVLVNGSLHQIALNLACREKKIDAGAKQDHPG